MKLFLVFSDKISQISPRLVPFLIINGNKNCKKTIFPHLRTIELEGGSTYENLERDNNQLDKPDINIDHSLDRNFGSVIMNHLYDSGDIVRNHCNAVRKRFPDTKKPRPVKNINQYDLKYAEIQMALEKLGKTK